MEVAITILVGFSALLVNTLIDYLTGQKKYENDREVIQAIQDRIKDAQTKLDTNPESIRPAWDIAQNTLEDYMRQNIKQLDRIYSISLSSMRMGFALIFLSVVMSVFVPTNLSPALIGAVAGIITEFIAATFMVMYRSTVDQATIYLKTLEKINTVGMSMQVLDTVSKQVDNHEHRQDKLIDAKIAIAKTLLNLAEQVEVPPTTTAG